MRAVFALVFPVVLCFGCANFQVKNTDGLRLAYEDVDLASSKGSQLRAMDDVAETRRQEAANLYRDAKAVINGYFQQTITDASGFVVDRDVNSYKATKGSERVAAFRKKVDELRGPDVTMQGIGDWAPLAITAIEEIKKLHDQDQRAAYDRFIGTVNKYMMKNFEELPGRGLVGD